MSIASRLQVLRGEKSRRSFANYLEVTESTLRNYESGASSPNTDFLIHVCEKMQVDANWLLFGRGSMKPCIEAPCGVYKKVVAVTNEDSLCGYQREILRDVVETIEEVLDELGRDMTSRAKAELVCDLYEMIEKGEAKHSRVQPSRVLKLIKGALASNG